eukprot:1631923-Lingulodinium_polyedra.AAC.1
MESAPGSSEESTEGVLVESTVGPLMEFTISSIVESREGSIGYPAVALRWIVQGRPRWARNG